MLTTRPLAAHDAGLLHRLYGRAPRYFQLISAPMPLDLDVHRELETALDDPRRSVEFVLAPDEVEPVGYLDLKYDYPGHGDATINLLLIAESHQSRGYGSLVVRDLEARLCDPAAAARRPVRRVLAGVFGHNPDAVRFWERLGYRYAIDARPILEWYAKDLAVPGAAAGAGLAARG
jgi:RimJ/RimL family protein N-acetyltransferase